MTVPKTLLAATVTAATLLGGPAPSYAQGGDPVVRFLNSLFPDANLRSGGAHRNDDDDDDDGRGHWNDDDDDGRGGGRDDDDDDGGGHDDDDD